MKKLISVLAVVFMIMALGATTAFAHCHSGGKATTKYTVCSVESCDLTGIHTHSDQFYTAHYDGDGHTYHDICSVANCTLTGYHEHSGEYCFGHYANDGHSYHNAGGCHR